MPQPDAIDIGAGAACSISADRAFSALYDLYVDCEQVPALMIKYALCDPLPGRRCLRRWEGRHLCDRQGLAFAACDRSGHSLYLEELDGSGS